MVKTKKKVQTPELRKDVVSRSLLAWMDRKLTERFIKKAGVKTQSEITHIKLTIWDFLAELEQKLLKQ